MKSKIDRTKIPVPGQPRPFNFPEFNLHQQANGLQTIVVHKNNLPLVNVLYHVEFSPLDDQPGFEGQANLLTYLLLEGTKKLRSEQIAEHFERLGANYNTHLSWNGFFFELNILRQHLKKGLELATEILHESILPQTEFLRLKQETLIDRLQIKDMPGRLASEYLLKRLFAGHRYALPIEGQHATIQKIELDQLHNLYQQTFLKRRPTLIFSGQITESEALPLSDSLFASSIFKSGEAQSVPSFTVPSSQKIVLIHKPKAAQIELRIGQFIPPRQHQDFFKIKLMNEIFGGYFLSRLNLNLREKNGYTYGIHSHLTYRPQVGLLTISASIQNEFIVPALQEIFNETQRLKEQGVTNDELRSAAGYLIGVFPTAFETIDQISDAIANIVTYRLPKDYYRTFREHIAAVTVEQINQAANHYLQPQQMQVVLVGDRQVVETSLRKQFELEVVNLNDKH